MPAGDMRHRLVIQSKTVTRGTDGAEVVTWTKVCSIWVKLDTPTGREGVAQVEALATVTHIFTTRYRGDITPSMQAVETTPKATRTYLLHSILPDNEHFMMQIYASEIVTT